MMMMMMITITKTMMIMMMMMIMTVAAAKDEDEDEDEEEEWEELPSRRDGVHPNQGSEVLRPHQTQDDQKPPVFWREGGVIRLTSPPSYPCASAEETWENWVGCRVCGFWVHGR